MLILSEGKREGGGGEGTYFARWRSGPGHQSRCCRRVGLKCRVFGGRVACRKNCFCQSLLKVAAEGGRGGEDELVDDEGTGGTGIVDWCVWLYGLFYEAGGGHCRYVAEW